MNIQFIDLLEAVINSDAKFVNGVLEKAKSKINKIQDKSVKNVTKIVNAEFAKIKSPKFDSIEFQLAKKGNSPSARQEAVHVVQGMADNGGHIYVYVDEGIPESFITDFKYWKVFIDVVTEVISHEMVHMGQFDRIMTRYEGDPNGYVKAMNDLSNREVSDHKKYLAIPLEIMAFSRQAVEEFRSHGLNNKKIIKYLKHYSDADPNDSYIFFAYTYYFKKDEKPLKRFLKYIYDYVKE